MIKQQRLQHRRVGNATLTRRNIRREPGFGTSVVAWSLLAMAVSTFSACVLLPEWRAYQSVCIAKQEAQFRVESLRELVDREQRFLTAIQTDPAVVARLARRELPYRYPGDEIVTVDIPSAPDDDVNVFDPSPVELPASLARAAERLPDIDYDGLFCDDRTRLPLMAMSVGLMGVGVWLPRRYG